MCAVVVAVHFMIFSFFLLFQQDLFTRLAGWQGRVKRGGVEGEYFSFSKDT